MNTSPLFNSIDNNGHNGSIPSSPINISNFNSNNAFQQQQQQHKRRLSGNGGNTQYYSSNYKSSNNPYLYNSGSNSGANSENSSKQQTPYLLSESYTNSMIPDPLEYNLNNVDDNETFTKNLKYNMNGKSNNQKKQQQQGEDEYFDTNSDLGYLTVTSKDDLIVCLNVLKKEIHQFKNLSQSLLSRLMSLERGVGNEKSLRSSPIPSRHNQIDNGGFDEGGNYASSLTSSPSNSPPNNIFQFLNNSASTGTSTTNKLSTEILLSNAINEIHRLIEKQKQYDNILSQREKVWDLDLNKLTMAILSKFNSNNGNGNSEQFNSESSEASFFNENNVNEQSSLYIDQQQPKSLHNSNESNASTTNSTALRNIDQSTISGKIKYQLYRIYYFFNRKRSISLWKKVLIIGIIVIVWPIIAQLLWKGIQYLINKRRLNRANAVKNSSISAIKPNKLKNILPNTNIRNPITIISGAGNNTNNNNTGGGILSRLFKRKNNVNAVGNVINADTKNIRAPDIVKAIIQGASTGDGGSNNNLTNNTISSMNTMLNSVMIPAGAAATALAVNSSSTMNNQSSASGIGSNSISPSNSSPSTSLSPLSSPNTSTITNNSTASNLINNLTPSAISSLNLPNSSSSINNDITVIKSMESSIPIFSPSSSLPSTPTISRNSSNNNNSQQANSVMFKMVKNLLSQKAR